MHTIFTLVQRPFSREESREQKHCQLPLKATEDEEEVTESLASAREVR